MDTNLKERLVTCLSCCHDYTTKEPGPKCPTCKRNLITVMYSTLDGSRITGCTPAQAGLSVNLIPGVVR
jgi:hypothetical protein